MTDYTKLVKELRGCKDMDYCTDCPRMANGYVEFCDIKDDAADAIEALQKDLTTLQKCYEIADTTVDEVLKQLPKRGKWELIDGAEPMRWGCSRCKYMSWETSNYCPRCGAKMEVQG